MTTEVEQAQSKRAPMNKKETDRINKELGNLLKESREKFNMSQADVGFWVGLDQSAISRVEAGQQQLSAAQWITFCAVMEITPDLFLGMKAEQCIS